MPNEAIARAGDAGGDWGESLIQASALGAPESVVVGAGGALSYGELVNGIAGGDGIVIVELYA